MSEVSQRRPFQFRLRTILYLIAGLAVFLAFDRAADGTPLDGLAQLLGIVYSVMLGVTLFGGSSRFA